MYQCYCEENIDPKRWALGYRTCTDCGQRQAIEQAKDRMRSVIDSHKSNPVFLRPETARQTLLDVTRMRRG